MKILNWLKNKYWLWGTILGFIIIELYGLYFCLYLLPETYMAPGAVQFLNIHKISEFQEQ